MSTDETILIVDDSPDNLVVMKQVIAKALPDLTILTCQHPEKAMPLLRDTDVAVALLDVQMPGIDGLELCKRIKDSEATQLVSVILITSHDSQPKMKARGLEHGADDFIMRPIDNAEINARVKVALRIHRSKTAMKRTASDALRRFETIVSCSPDMMAMLDRDYVYLAANDAYASAFGKARADIEGHSVVQVFGEKFFEAVIRPYAERCLAGEDVRYSNWFDFPATGRQFMDVAYSPYKGGNGKIEGVVVNARDITERKVTEASQEETLAALHLERQRLDYLIEGSRLGTWAWNIQENSALFNEMWATLLGYTMDEVGPSSYELWKSLGHPDDVPRIEALLQQCATGQMLDYSGEFRMRHKDGHWVWILDRGRVMTHDAEGRPLEMFGTHTDITELKIVEAELEKHREHLEEQVQERTEKLRKTINLMAGRENRMAELKRAIRKLRTQLEEAGMNPVAGDPMKEGPSGKDDASNV